MEVDLINIFLGWRKFFLHLFKFYLCKTKITTYLLTRKIYERRVVIIIRKEKKIKYKHC